MATSEKKEAIKMIYTPAGEPVKPVRTADVDDAEWAAMIAEYEVEHAEWVREQEDAAKMAARPSDPTDGPGPAEKPVVNAENPVWENPLYYGDPAKGPGQPLDPSKGPGPR